MFERQHAMTQEPLAANSNSSAWTAQRAGIATCALGMVLMSQGLAAELPLAVAGKLGASVGGTAILLDPIYGIALATLEDPSSLLPEAPRSMVLQTTTSTLITGKTPVLRVLDVLPEFWAEPAVWGHFLKGPGAASGFGNEILPRDWAGRPATDRRAYPLDAGLRSVELAESFSIPFTLGTLHINYLRSGILLSFTGRAAHAYAIQYTAALTRPFSVIQTVISPDSSSQTAVLPILGGSGFFRVVELTP